DDFRTRGVPWTIKRTLLERGRALRSDRKNLAQRRSGAVAGCRDSARLRRCCGCCAEKTWRPSRARWASRRRRSPAGSTLCLAADEAALTTRAATGEELESDRLKARLGAVLMERDLLAREDRSSGGRPPFCPTQAQAMSRVLSPITG